MTSLSTLNLNNDFSRHHEYLSMTVAIETLQELSSFLNTILKEITGEDEITWSLVDALDIFMVSGE